MEANSDSVLLKSKRGRSLMSSLLKALHRRGIVKVQGDLRNAMRDEVLHRMRESDSGVDASRIDVDWRNHTVDRILARSGQIPLLEVIVTDDGLLYSFMDPNPTISVDESLRVFINVKTGAVAGRWSDSDAESDYGEDINKESYGPGWIELPRPTSEDLYDWFAQFVTAKGHPDFYAYRIGRWKRECATDDEIYEWDDYEWNCRLAFAINAARERGIKLIVS